MMGQDRNDIGSIGTQGQKTKRPGRHPLLVGGLAVGLIALGASAAVAVGIPGDPPPVPLTISDSDMKMPSHEEMSMMGSSDLKMPSHKGKSMTTGKGAGAGTCTMGSPTLGA